MSRPFGGGSSELSSKTSVIFADSVGQVFTVFQTFDQKSPPEPCLTSNQPPAVWELRACPAVDMEMTFAVSKGGSAPSTVTVSDIRTMTAVS